MAAAAAAPEARALVFNPSSAPSSAEIIITGSSFDPCNNFGDQSWIYSGDTPIKVGGSCSFPQTFDAYFFSEPLADGDYSAVEFDTGGNDCSSLTLAQCLALDPSVLTTFSVGAAPAPAAGGWFTAATGTAAKIIEPTSGAFADQGMQIIISTIIGILIFFYVGQHIIDLPPSPKDVARLEAHDRAVARRRRSKKS